MHKIGVFIIVICDLFIWRNCILGHVMLKVYQYVTNEEKVYQIIKEINLFETHVTWTKQLGKRK
jgi:hypothetical protein